MKKAIKIMGIVDKTGPDAVMDNWFLATLTWNQFAQLAKLSAQIAAHNEYFDRLDSLAASEGLHMESITLYGYGLESFEFMPANFSDIDVAFSAAETGMAAYRMRGVRGVRSPRNDKLKPRGDNPALGGVNLRLIVEPGHVYWTWDPDVLHVPEGGTCISERFSLDILHKAFGHTGEEHTLAEQGKA